jgi:hypothetical protein
MMHLEDEGGILVALGSAFAALKITSVLRNGICSLTAFALSGPSSLKVLGLPF